MSWKRTQRRFHIFAQGAAARAEAAGARARPSRGRGDARRGPARRGRAARARSETHPPEAENSGRGNPGPRSGTLTWRRQPGVNEPGEAVEATAFALRRIPPSAQAARGLPGARSWTPCPSGVRGVRSVGRRGGGAGGGRLIPEGPLEAEPQEGPEGGTQEPTPTPDHRLTKEQFSVQRAVSLDLTRRHGPLRVLARSPPPTLPATCPGMAASQVVRRPLWNTLVTLGRLPALGVICSIAWPPGMLGLGVSFPGCWGPFPGCLARRSLRRTVLHQLLRQCVPEGHSPLQWGWGSDRPGQAHRGEPTCAAPGCFPRGFDG